MNHFETEVYPRIWRSAWYAGQAAKLIGMSRECNLQGSLFCTATGTILKVYKSAWEQGYDLIGLGNHENSL